MRHYENLWSYCAKHLANGISLDDIRRIEDPNSLPSSHESSEDTTSNPAVDGWLRSLRQVQDDKRSLHWFWSILTLKFPCVWHDCSNNASISSTRIEQAKGAGGRCPRQWSYCWLFVFPLYLPAVGTYRTEQKTVFFPAATQQQRTARTLKKRGRSLDINLFRTTIPLKL